jgi:membrane-associated protease RseP (regulator of RpoE activity)
MAVVGIGAWVALFAVLALLSWWFVAFVVGLLVSVFLHEVGHFLTARRSGMKVTQFFMGFGPRVWSFHRNGVEYGLRLIPLGAFVRIIGMNALDEVEPGDEARTYRASTYPRKMWVITAGSVMHMILAMIMITGVYAVAGRLEESGQVTIGAVLPDSAATDAGLQEGDVVTAVNGEPVVRADVFRAEIAAIPPGDTVVLDISRDGEPLQVTATLGKRSDGDPSRGYLGVRSESVDRVQKGPVEAVALGASDLVTGVGQAITGIVKVVNPVNVWNHLVGNTDDPTTQPGTIVGATRISDDIGRFDGWAGFFALLAAVNVSVGVFNMFPMLPLDGGHAAIATYERIRSRRGRPYVADVQKLMPVVAVTVALIAFMFLTGLYLDIVRPVR